MAAKLRPDFHILKRVEKDNQYAAASAYAKDLASVASTTGWFEGKQKFDFAEGEKRRKSFIENEMQCCSEELKIRRRTRLRKLYEMEARGWEEELASHGLAVQRQHY
mmetsp:Transcript_123435/g.394874  ORF Transcript_123435/g.394874 Transcript_123435/m.394874 type:complete len:107 (-) Transcript_123435:53-373(-)